MEVEKWKDISGCPGYQVSNLGRVKSMERKVSNGKSYRIVCEKILKPVKHSNGYLKVILSKYGEKKSYFIHRLVAAAFVQNESLFYNEINHIDECKTNNCASNLQWCEHIYNMNYGTRTERASKSNTNGKKSKSVICIETGVVYPSIKEVQRKLGFNNSSITRCCIGKQNTCGKLHWKYVE